MAYLLRKCEKCGREIRAVVGQPWQHEKLRWCVSTSCPVCGPVSEEDGLGIPPAHVREAILQQEGEWELRVPEAEMRWLGQRVSAECGYEAVVGRRTCSPK